VTAYEAIYYLGGRKFKTTRYTKYPTNISAEKVINLSEGRRNLGSF
jgi:hypothetical protein